MISFMVPTKPDWSGLVLSTQNLSYNSEFVHLPSWYRPLVFKDTWLNYFQTNPALPTAGYLDQVCSINQKLKDTISDEFGVGEGKIYLFSSL